MSEAAPFYDQIDAARAQRAKELSEIKRLFATGAEDPLGVFSKAAVVLCYANWEGFYNECVRIYVEYLQEHGCEVSSVSWLLLVGALNPEFESLRGKNHSLDGKRAFVDKLKERLSCGFADFDKTVIEARSNLNFAKLSSNFTLLNFDRSRFEAKRIRLDKELVGWRHGVAHGDAPDLGLLDIRQHVEFASEMLLEISDLFQEAILAQSLQPVA